MSNIKWPEEPAIRIYTALLTQSGTNAPVATILHNTLGGTINWARSSSGSYTGTLTGVFKEDKTWCIAGDNLGSGARFLIGRTNDNVITLECDADNDLSSTPVEIRVYK